MNRRIDAVAVPRLVPVLVLAVLVAGCGPAAAGVPNPAAQPPAADAPVGDPGGTPSGSPGPAAGMCAADMPDCVDTVVEPDAGDYPVEEDRRAAQALLGTLESQLPGDVRVGRRGGEHMAMTEDYVLGRMTVGVDPGEDGEHVVTEVTVELPDGPETFFLDA